MKEYLKVGQKFEVVEVLHSLYDVALKEGDITVGVEGIGNCYQVLTTSLEEGFKWGFSWTLYSEYAKPLGRLVITKIK